MTAYEVAVEVIVRIDLNNAAGEHSITRYVDNEDGIQGSLYGPMTRDEVLGHLANNAACNGVVDANLLDGWADLADDSVTMRVNGLARLPLSVDEVSQ